MKMFNIISKLTLVFGFGAFLATPAFADGFVCEAPAENINIRVFNRTDPGQGTRNVAVMVVSDPSLPFGKRTVARFEADEGRVSNVGTVYTAVMNPQPMVISKTIAGMRLAQIQEVLLRVDFKYRRPVEHGTIVGAVLELYNINGDQLWVDMDCARYLKGSTN